MAKFTQEHLDALVHRHMRYESDEHIDLFKHLLGQGFEPVFAAMHATRSYPGVVGTDTQFRSANHKQIERAPPAVREAMRKRRGYSGNAVFHHQLGEWVEGVADIKKAAQRKNKTVELADGKVLHEGHYVPRVKKPLADKLVHDRMLMYAQQDPSLVSTPERARKLKEDVINRHTPHWRKKDTVIE